MGLNGHALSSYIMMARFMKVELALGSFMCIKVFWLLRKIEKGIVNKFSDLG